MTSNPKVNILIPLLVQAVTWSLGNSLPAEGVQLSPWDDNDWFRRFTTPRPIIWKFTFSPDTYKIKPSTSAPPAIVWFIVAGAILISILAALIKYACAQMASNTYESTPTLHPPPTLIIRPPHMAAPQSRPENASNSSTHFGGGFAEYPAWSTARVPSSSSTRPPGGPQSARNSNTLFREDLFAYSASSTTRVPVTSTYSTSDSTVCTSDRPPGYSEVVISDFVEENKKFPEVSPKPLDTPPPKYEDGNLPRY